MCIFHLVASIQPNILVQALRKPTFDWLFYPKGQRSQICCQKNQITYTHMMGFLLHKILPHF